jgi:hypothetical protein
MVMIASDDKMPEDVVANSSTALKRYLELEEIVRKFFDEQAPDFCKNSISDHGCLYCCHGSGTE